MVKKKKKKYLFKIILFSIIMIIIFGLNSFYFLIIKPSYVSYSMVCIPGKSQEYADLGYLVAGSITIIQPQEQFPKKPVEVKIDINILTNKTIKHELCHVKQHERGYFSQECSHPYQKILSEVECYSTEYIPMKIYNLLYYNEEEINELLN